MVGESSFPKTADVVVIGGGVMGASTAYHLVRMNGLRVVLLERREHFGMEATGKCAGGIRHQFDSEINIRLSLLSLPLLDRFEEETGQPAGVKKCGYLFVLTEERDIGEFRRQAALQNGLGVRTEWLDGDEVRRRLPLFVFPDALAATWGPDDGLADPASVVQGYIAAARRRGAVCLTDVEATGVRIEAGRVRGVSTTRGFISSPVVVNAAGPWAGCIGETAGIDIPVSPVRRQIAVTTPIPDLPEDLPFVIDSARSLYFHREGPAVLTGMSNPAEPTGFDQSVDDDWEAVHLDAACRRLPLLENAGIASRWAGLYENTPDAHPILGGAEEVEGFHLITGFSGHGFMHGPACGLLLAEEILEGRARTLDITPLRLSRFRKGSPSPEYNVV